MSRSVHQWHQHLISYGLAPYLVTVIWFFCRVGDREKPLDWDYVKALFRSISPYFWAAVGMYLAVSTSVLGAAWCVPYDSTARTRCCAVAATDRCFFESWANSYSYYVVGGRDYPVMSREPSRVTCPCWPGGGSGARKTRTPSQAKYHSVCVLTDSICASAVCMCD
jgi:hypothetical protein